MNVLATYYLQSVMQERLAMTVSALRSLVMSTLMLFALPPVLGLAGVFLAMPVSECIVAILALVIVRRTKLER